MDLYPHAVVENFFDDPNKVRDLALSQQYSYFHEMSISDYVFPGCRTEEIYKIDQGYYQNFCKKLISIFHNLNHDVMQWSISTSFQIVEGRFGKGAIHQDDSTIFAGVIYLTPNAPLDGGTSIFKPKKNFSEMKLKKANDINKALFKAGKPILTDYHEMFEETLRVNNVFNTLVLFNGDSFHAANNFFGDNLYTGRLCQVFFIKKIDAKSYNVFPIKRMRNINI